MVRPAARFRPAARRTQDGQLVPVFFTRPTGTPGPLTLRSGSEPGGVVKELNIYDDAPRTLAPTASKGLLNRVKSAILGVNANYIFLTENETVTAEESFTVLRQDVINGVAYIFCLRTHLARHTASVTYQAPGSSGPVLSESTEAVPDAIYDVAVFAVNLQTGAYTTSSKVVYELQGSIDVYVFLSFPASADATEFRYPVALAFSEILPTQHPFAACGPLAWGSDDIEVIQGRPPSVNSANTLFSLTPRAFAQFTTQMWRDYSAMRGLDTANTRRLIQSGTVLELSGYESFQSVACDLYQSIGVLWIDSFAEYDPQQLQDREEVFADLSGLSASDEALFLQSNLQPPLAIQGGSSAAGATVDPLYFLTGSSFGGLSFVQNQLLTIRYWITG